MPALSPTMVSGTVQEWVVSEGDSVEPGDSIATIDTDKASVDFEVQDSGVLAKILIQAGTEDVPVGKVLALMVDDESDLPEVQGKDWEALLSSGGGHQEAPSEGSNASRSPGAAEAGEPNFGDKRASPAAAHMVRSHGLDISGLTGTGRHGMVTKGDVLVFMGKAPASSLPSARTDSGAAETPVETPQAASRAEAAAEAPQPQQPAPVFGLGDVLDFAGDLPAVEFGDGSRPSSVESGSFSDTKPSMVRKVISSRLTESKATVPHSYSVMDCRIDALLDLRKQLKAAGVNVSVNDLVIKAVARSLEAVPEANCHFDEASGSIKANDSVDISVAVATEGGLITPIVTHADTRGLASINESVRDLASRARKNKLAPEEYQGGSFTVSNLGMFGIDEFSAVINPPQACILAIGRGAERAVFADDIAVDVQAVADAPASEPEVATIMSVMMSADRRVVDDAIAAQFLASFRKHCETPALLMA